MWPNQSPEVLADGYLTVGAGGGAKVAGAVP
jgi:hypothetical protein